MHMVKNSVDICGVVSSTMYDVLQLRLRVPWLIEFNFPTGEEAYFQ